jgi:hypothetical protein
MGISIFSSGHEGTKNDKPKDPRNYFEKRIDQRQITGSLMFSEGIMSYLKSLIWQFDIPEKIDEKWGYGTVTELPEWFRSPGFVPEIVPLEKGETYNTNLPYSPPETLRTLVHKAIEGIIAITEYYSIK